LELKKAEPLDKEVLPFDCLDSPDCSIDRTFTSTFYFPHKVTKANQIARIYRNPIYLAQEYKRMIYNGQVKNQSGLAYKLGISRVRIHQILSLLKLDSLIVQELEKLGDPLKAKIITERMLRPYANQSLQQQTTLLYILKSFFLDKK
jgi:hypothetical protein